MKKVIFLFTFFLVLQLNYLAAQNQNNKFGITTKVLFLDNLTPLDGVNIIEPDNFDATTTGMEIGFFKNLNKFVNIGVPIRLAAADVRRRGMPNTFASDSEFSLDLVGQLGYFAADYWITPYLQAGVGGQVYSQGNNADWMAAFPVGVGLDFRLHPNVYLQAQSEYRFTSKENREQIVYSLGLLFALGGDQAPKPPVDADGDGISDVEDDCPLLAGPATTKGCPDADGDLVADKNDDCPAEAGLAKFSGCPDTDEDGVEDKMDECPTEPGLVELKGCPVRDADGDGVADEVDKCPTQAGTLSMQGCPDGDSDGVADKDDNCPTEAGTIANNGCPEVKILDGDKDGVPDNLDKCPTTAGPASNNGCPVITVEDKVILNLAVSNIEFNTARATLKASSNATLDQIVALLNKYGDYKLAIGGHTDSIGTAKQNQLLSERRAKSCYDYLLSKGVSPSRVSYVGYGETQPIADNMYKAGREKNRRVEFNLFLP